VNIRFLLFFPLILSTVTSSSSVSLVVSTVTSSSSVSLVVSTVTSSSSVFEAHDVSSLDSVSESSSLILLLLDFFSFLDFEDSFSSLDSNGSFSFFDFKDFFSFFDFKDFFSYLACLGVAIDPGAVNSSAL